MNTVKTLWASVQGDPVFMRRVNGWMTVFWIAMIPVSLLTGWINSVTYVAGLSLWALVSGHWSAWQAARVEVEQQREIQEREANPTEQRVVEALVEQTTIEPAVLATRRGRSRSLGIRVAGPHRTSNTVRTPDRSECPLHAHDATTITRTEHRWWSGCQMVRPVGGHAARWRSGRRPIQDRGA